MTLQYELIGSALFVLVLFILARAVAPPPKKERWQAFVKEGNAFLDLLAKADKPAGNGYYTLMSPDGNVFIKEINGRRCLVCFSDWGDAQHFRTALCSWNYHKVKQLESIDNFPYVILDGKEVDTNITLFKQKAMSA